MISYLEGKIILKKENFVILQVAGVGYEVFISARVLQKLPVESQPLKVFCYLDVGERSLRLYGFLTFAELELFRLVRNISGVGPKAALEIASLGPAEEIKKKIERGEQGVFEGVPGIGVKKAQKIILELSGKIKTEEPKTKEQKNHFENDDAFLALLNLGFSKEQAKRALASVPAAVKDVQERVRQALGHLST